VRVVHDLFPARVRVVPPEQAPAALAAAELSTFTAAFGRVVDRTRVVVTEKTVMVAADADAGPVLVFREKYDPATLVWSKRRSPRDVNRLVTLTGKLLVVQFSDGCGCGSRLRAWNPYRTVYSSGDPVE
jgi:hypothetical protein